MAYANQCTTWRTPLLFSNPEKTYRGAAAGIAGLAPSNAVDGPSDAVRALNRTRAYAADFRQAPDITVFFGAATYTATEDGSTATVAVQLSAAPTRSIEIPLSWTPAKGGTAATAYDFGGVPAAVRFGANDTESTFTVTAVDDAADEDDETIALTLGEPTARGVTRGNPSETTVTVTDNDTETAAPSILELEVTSDPGSDRVHETGDLIEVSVRFDKTVTVVGSPQLALTVRSSATRQATYQDSAGDVMRFTYTVTAADGAIGGVSLAADSLALNSGTIRDGDDQDASLSHDAIAGGRPYDTDSDGLIEITTLAQLAAVGGPGRLRRADHHREVDVPGRVPGRRHAAELYRRVRGVRAGRRPRSRHERERYGRFGRHVLERRQRLGAGRGLQPSVAQDQSLPGDLRGQRPHDREPVHQPHR